MFKQFMRLLGALNPLRGLRRAAFALANLRRRLVHSLDYILITLPSTLPALPEKRSWWQQRVLGPPPLSQWELGRLFDQIADDPRLRGVVLNLRGFSMSLADLQSLRAMLLRLRVGGKEVICYAQDYDNATYFIASAADRIVLQPGGELRTVGLLQQAMFLKDAFDTVGVSLDVVAISPYKSAFDQLTRSDFSPEARQQLEWLLDSRYDILVRGIAEGRKRTPEAVRAMIDGAPYLDEEALAEGFVDAIRNEEGLPAFLGTKQLIPLHQARKALFKKWRRHSGQYIAVLPLTGTIIQGSSGRPPVEPPIPLPLIGTERLGDLTAVQRVRQLMQDKRAAAVVLLVDSPGGSAAASEAITAALHELARDRPVVAYMNAIAGSGGYYISTPAQWIVAQHATITGSIGVISAKLVTAPLWDRLGVRRVDLTRGANANLLSDAAGFDAAQRRRMMQQVTRLYHLFVGHVARSRGLSFEAVDAVAGGRVWTGEQAKAHGLVDELGDLRAAIRKARELANLPEDAPVALAQDGGKPLAPQLAEQANPAALLRYIHEGTQALFDGKAQMLMPWLIE